jgi:hypothetical protein
MMICFEEIITYKSEKWEWRNEEVSTGKPLLIKRYACYTQQK